MERGVIIMLNDKQKKIVHHRWVIFAIIIAVLITVLGLWPIVFYFGAGLLMLYLAIEGIGWLITWLSGEDLTNPNNRHATDEHHDDSVSDTLWDIETLHAMHHHDDSYAHYHDYLNDDDHNDDNNDLN